MAERETHLTSAIRQRGTSAEFFLRRISEHEDREYLRMFGPLPSPTEIEEEENEVKSKRRRTIFPENTKIRQNPQGEPRITREVVYSNHWNEKPKPRTGETPERILLILGEHIGRYPNVPVDFTTIGQAIGGVTRANVSQHYKRLEEIGLIPDGIQKKKSVKRSSEKP